ncbi:MAG TPA: CDP-diacylglycerol--glycerol-3-phosphate 3-phosphatidyltransferase [Spirochaetales bacterium]|nr:CDP-diacylglycerol--glycerol-3-phosphate 3-phosphatidyltransferase [Spirochaetales bacterium]
MSRADKITLSRIILAPFFFLIYEYSLFPPTISIAFLWILYALMELSDLFDGRVARSEGKVSDFGKLFDPFADVFARLTYFVCFAFSGIMPLWIFVIILYRELSVLFLRMLLGFRGIALGARRGGKLKAGLYMASGLLSLVIFSFEGLSLTPSWAPALRTILLVIYVAAAVLSVASFIDYILQYRKLTKSTKNP